MILVGHCLQAIILSESDIVDLVFLISPKKPLSINRRRTKAERLFMKNVFFVDK
jgi:hypothetical protein